MTSRPADQDALIAMTRDIVVAEITHNPVPHDAVPELIERVFESLRRISRPAVANAPAPTAAEMPAPAARAWSPAPEQVASSRITPTVDPAAVVRTPGGTGQPTTWGTGGVAEPRRTARAEGREPVVPREQSVRPDHIVCLFDGVKRKMLKRHLKTRYGMAPAAYRDYWELPDDYPMTAPDYSIEKRDYAMQTGFGLPRRGRRRAA